MHQSYSTLSYKPPYFPKAMCMLFIPIFYYKHMYIYEQILIFIYFYTNDEKLTRIIYEFFRPEIYLDKYDMNNQTTCNIFYCV